MARLQPVPPHGRFGWRHRIDTVHNFKSAECAIPCREWPVQPLAVYVIMMPRQDKRIGWKAARPLGPRRRREIPVSYRDIAMNTAKNPVGR